MSTLAPTLQAFFTDRLARQRQASPHTIAAYRDTVKLLLVFTEQRTDKSPSDMDITDLDAPLIGAFLNHLKPTAATASGPATPGWRPFTRCSATARCTTRRMPRSSRGCWRSHPNASTGP